MQGSLQVLNHDIEPGLGIEMAYSKKMNGTSLVAQWLRLHAPEAGDMGSIPGQGTKIPHAAWHGEKTTED